MQPTPRLADEFTRLEELESYHLLDTFSEPEFDAVARLAAAVCGAPIALVSLVDHRRQWLKSVIGLPVQRREIPRDIAFCAHAIQGDELFEVPDATADERFRDNPLVTGEPRIRFYAGMPLTSPAGLRLGTLCVIDRQPRELSIMQREALHDLSTVLITIMEGRRIRQSLRQLQLEQQQELELAAGAIDEIVDAQCLRDPCLQRVLLPASRSSGDVIAVQRKPSGAICGMLADVTGHGLSSALAVIPAVQAFYTMCWKDLPRETICFELNEKVRRLAQSGRFVAAVIFEIDPASRTVAVWNGAMPAALYLDGAGELLCQWSSIHPALGVLPDHELKPVFESYRWTTPGQFLAFSDGLVEAALDSGPVPAVLRVADVLRGTSADVRVQRLVQIIHSLRDRSAQRDDVAILAVDCEELLLQCTAAAFPAPPSAD
ncbi:MAG TPA: GAF domain-containing SpoIIE family protein phosphatase [Burkholderiales bacterium]|nr:GAF domain-containing SpoIIE family protein phosphatase [Burkholderiales bacterium]